MRVTYCDGCDEEIKREFRGASLGKVSVVLEIPDYIIDKKPQGDPEKTTPYELCWYCQNEIQRVSYLTLLKLKKEREQKHEVHSKGIRPTRLDR